VFLSPRSARWGSLASVIGSFCLALASTLNGDGHDRCLAAGSAEQGGEERSRPRARAAGSPPDGRVDQRDAPERERLHLRSLAAGTVPAPSRAGVKETPVTPALINRTVATVVGIMEPGQPRLGREFCQALRTARPDAPSQLRYRSTHHGVIRVATIFDLGPEHDRLYVHCREE